MDACEVGYCRLRATLICKPGPTGLLTSAGMTNEERAISHRGGKVFSDSLPPAGKSAPAQPLARFLSGIFPHPGIRRYIARSPSPPRGVSRASSDAGRVAVAATRGITHPARGGPSRTGPARRPRVTRDPPGLALACFPKHGAPVRTRSAVDRAWAHAAPRRGSGKSTGVRAEQASNTACGMPGSLPAPAVNTSRAVLALLHEAVGTGSPRHPARPRTDVPGAREPSMPRAEFPPRERERLFEN